MHTLLKLFSLGLLVQKKKALQHYKVYDFTPTQLVFGRNPNLLSNLLLAMEDVSHGDIVVKHLNTLDQ